MEFQENFKFLKIDVIKRKNAKDLPEDEQSFLKLNVLDKTNSPCAFMIFDKDIIRQLLAEPHTSFADILITFDLVYSNNWNVKVVDVRG